MSGQNLVANTFDATDVCTQCTGALYSTKYNVKLASSLPHCLRFCNMSVVCFLLVRRRPSRSYSSVQRQHSPRYTLALV